MDPLFAPIDELFDTFGDASSAQFACWSYPSFRLRGGWVGRGITRELRCGTAEDCCVRLALHDVGTEWRRVLTQRLTRAGYRVGSDDDLQRFWHGARERDRELAFAHSLGKLGKPTRWPKRKPSRKRHHVRSTREVRAVIEAARRAHIRWHHVVGIVSRRMISPDGRLSATVYVLLDVAPHLHGQAIELSVMTKSDDAQRFNRARLVMRHAGFNGGRPPQAWFGHKRVRSIAAALRERDSILKRLMVL